MSHIDPGVRKLKQALSMGKGRLEELFIEARRDVLDLRVRLKEAELHMAQARELLDLTSVRIPWPPLGLPPRPPTLHEAMQIVLEQKEGDWMRTRDLAYEIARRGLYRRRDGLPASVNDVSARINTYPGLFVRDGYVVRLRMARRRGLGYRSVR
jgi:hypothetical protein